MLQENCLEQINQKAPAELRPQMAWLGFLGFLRSKETDHIIKTSNQPA